MSNAIRSFLFLLAPAIVFADGGIASLRPLYTPETAVLNPALVDLWVDGGTSFRIEPDDKAGYQVILGGEQFLAFRLVQLGSETIADIVFPSKLFEPRLPMHRFGRIRLEGNALLVDWLGSEELEQRIVRSGSPRHEQVDADGEDLLILTGSTAELQRFLLDCLKQPDAFKESDKYERAGPEPRAVELNDRSWAVVSDRSARPDACASALKQAEEAVKLIPGDPNYWNTLGAAQYRAGRFSEALAAITRAGQLRKADSPEDMVFRAMAHHQLGEKAEAKKLLGDLQKMLGDSRYREDLDMLKLLHQAEDLIAPKGK